MLRLKITLIVICFFCIYESILYPQGSKKMNSRLNLKEVKKSKQSVQTENKITEIKNLLNDEPENTNLLKSLGDVYRSISDYDSAINLYSLALDIAPNDVEANLGIAISYFYLHKWDLARKHFRINILNNYRIKIAYDLLGKIEIYSNNLNAAKKYFSMLLTLDSANVEALTNLGIIYQEKGDLLKAEEYLLKAVSVNPDDYLPYLNLGVFYDAMNNHDESLRNLNKSLELNPDNSKAYKALGIVFLNNKVYDVAEKLFLSALSVDKNETDVYFYLILLYSEINKYNEAIAISKEIDSLGVTHTQINIALSNLYFKIHDYDKALEFAHEQVEHFPEQIEGYVLLMGLYDFLGMEKEHQSISSVVAKKFPDYSFQLNNWNNAIK